MVNKVIFLLWRNLVIFYYLGILFDIGIIESSDVKEVQRSDQIILCQIIFTARKTEEVIKKGSGNIIFVDEAYTLSSKSEKDYGKESLETIMKYMLPMCGYEAKMKEFLDTNRGLRRQIKQRFVFSDYSSTELCEILVNRLLKQ